MTGLLEFVSGLLDGIGLFALALALGGIAHVLVVLRVPQMASPLLAREAQRALRLAARAAWIMAGIRLLQLLLKPLALADTPGDWDLAAFAHTQVFRSRLLGVGLTGVLAGVLMWARSHVGARVRWAAVLASAAGFLVNEGWLSHAVSRVEGAGTLMLVTVIHMVGAAVWAGGITHLLLTRCRRTEPDLVAMWPEFVSRFSPLGIACVALILGPGIVLAWSYIGNLSGWLGTGYGNLLLVKVLLFACVLGLAAMNFTAGRQWRQSGPGDTLMRRVPAYVEVEIILAAGLLFTAAALTSFPPAIDIPSERVAPDDMWTMFRPKLPHLGGPQVIMIEAPELTDPHTGEVGHKPDVSWDRFNHNVSGVIVVLMAVLALLDRVGRVRWARHWPLMFLAFGVLIFVFSNPTEFPLGALGFWESAQDAEVVQHWLAAGVVVGLGWFEWRARQTTFQRRDLCYVFPLLCIGGGIILLTHSHNISELKQEFLTQGTHVAMGLLAVGMGSARWLELRLGPPQDRLAGAIAAGCMLLVGLILVFYADPADRESWNRLKGP